jgi:oligopeptide/dipeptide ABC transporter ATP-binding protein
MVNTPKERLLDIKNLRTSFFTKKGEIKAVDGVSFEVNRGEIVGLVGESGCGKSITSLSIMRLVPQPAGRIIGGQMLFCGEDLLKKTEAEMRKLRGDRLSMILQDPMVSLNQLLTVGYQLEETFRYHNKPGGSMREKCIEMLRRVKVPAPERRVENYPFQFSGGMSQRALIAMAIVNNPDLLIADEPTTALDVTIAAQVLELMRVIQEKSRASIILITHDLASVAQICTRVLVMYAGRIIEKAPIKTFYKDPAHPYSQGLIKSVPVLGRRTERLFSIDGMPPSLLNPPPGCRFAPRCNKVKDICAEKYPPEIRIDDEHLISCWLYEEG